VSEDVPVTRSSDAPEADVVVRLRAAGCVFAEDEARLLVSGAASPDELERLVARRVAGEPLEQVLGWAEFCGLRIVVQPGVFVPRRRSELLVREAVRLLRARDGAVTGHVVLDLCCGSGAVGTAIAAQLPGVQVHATDIDAAAVACARRNLGPVGGRVYQGDLDAPIPEMLRGRVAVVVANAPYVPTAEIALMPPEARLHEPRAALDGGSDGLDLQRRVIAAAPRWLAPDGLLLVETSERQAPATAAEFERRGMTPRVVRCDELDATAVVGRRPVVPTWDDGRP
jgi:release factor glutamine methyltransferase